MRNTRTYTDVDLKFLPHPTTKDVTVKIDEDAIKAAICNLLMTSHYERPFHSDIGSKLRHLIFEPITPVLYGIIRQDLSNLIHAYEPRAILLDVITTYHSDLNTIDIAVVFKMNGTSLVSTANISLERTK